MRILHLIGGGDTGGAKTHVLNLLKSLGEYEDVHLVSFRQGDFSEDACKLGIPTTIIDSRNLFSALSQLKKLISAKPVDIIHCHGARANLMGSLVKGFAKAPVVTTLHSDYLLDYLGRPAARLSYGVTNAIMLRRIPYYIVVSPPMADLLIDRKFPADSIYNICNGIDFSTPIPVVGRKEFLQSHNIPFADDDVIAGIAARLTPIKDIPTLLRAMKLLYDKNPRLKLIIAGDGEDDKMLRDMAKRLKIDDRVHFAGWLGDTNSFYNAIDINLLTSLSEGFPYVLNEGARMKCATISSDVGGISTMIEDGITGFTFKPGDDAHLAELLIKLSEDTALRKKMGKKIYERASTQFSINQMVNYQLDIYNSILRREKRRQRKGRDGIVICGAYGFGNTGDDAILESIVSSIREYDSEMPVTILTKNKLDIKKRYKVNAVYTFNLLSVFFRMKKSLLYINGGGSLIQNVTSQRSLNYYLFTLKLAKLTKNKVDMYGCGIGPLKGSRSIQRVRNVLNSSVDAITLREPDSVMELERIGVTKPEITLSCDPALVTQRTNDERTSLFLEKNGISMENRYICFLLRMWPGFHEKEQDIADAAMSAYENHGLIPLFIPMTFYYDDSAARSISKLLKCPHLILSETLNSPMLISVLSRMDVVVSMRLHGLIFSSISGVPHVGISYDPKIDSFLKYLGYGEFVTLEDLNSQDLKKAIDRAVSYIGKNNELKVYAQKLLVNEKINFDTVKRLLENSSR